MTEAYEALRLDAGTYRHEGGEGLRAITLGADGAWTVADAYPDAPNASFSVYSARYGLHYIVDEQAAGRVGVHRHDTGGWRRLASVSVAGDGPCHIALDRSETLLAVANYGSGSVSLP